MAEAGCASAAMNWMGGLRFSTSPVLFLVVAKHARQLWRALPSKMTQLLAVARSQLKLVSKLVLGPDVVGLQYLRIRPKAAAYRFLGVRVLG